MPNILLIEKEDSLRCLIKTYLRRPDRLFIEARTEREGLEILKQNKPDLVLLGVVIQNKDSWKMLKELKGGSGTRDIPVIVVTALDEKEKAIELGADSYILTPFGSDSLRREVERFL